MDSQDCQQPAGGEPGPGSAPGGLRIGPCFAWAGSETAFPEPTSPASICTVEGVPGRAAPCLAVRVGPLSPAASSPELARVALGPQDGPHGLALSSGHPVLSGHRKSLELLPAGARVPADDLDLWPLQLAASCSHLLVLSPPPCSFSAAAVGGGGTIRWQHPSNCL